MRVTTIQWQASGSKDVLDARLANGTGKSKIHVLATPVEWDGQSWARLARLTMMCGALTPRDEGWMAISVGQDPTMATCEHCRKVNGL